jgi:hypothetical protein
MTPPRPTVSDSAERIYASVHAFQEGDPDAGWPLLHLCEALARTMVATSDAIRHDELGSGQRRALSPTRAPARRLPYLRQYVGIRELPAGLTVEQQRQLLRDAPNLRRGTLGALIAATQISLTGDQTVLIAERNGSAYRITIGTRDDQTPDPEVTRRGARSQKDTGLVMTVVIVDGFTWLELYATTHAYRDDHGAIAYRSTYDTWEDIVDHFDTWEDVVAGIPTS